jgi:UTP--glucose-1-phosphate uridylyltransferase
MSRVPEVTTAVIAAAGSATRMWPASKVVPKELFPLGKWPTIVHLIAEFRGAGIRKIVLVVAEQGLGLMQGLLERSIRPPDKMVDDPLVQEFEAVLAQTEFILLKQSGAYGNAVPLVVAADEVGGQPCVYAFGDDVVLGENATEGLLEIYRATRRPVLAAQEVEESKKRQFGILEGAREDGIFYVSRLVEKPGPGETKSNLASFGRYVVTPDLLETLLTVRAGRDGEVWFVDGVIQQIAGGKRICAYPLRQGTWYTVGDPQSYARAVAAATAARPRESHQTTIHR